MVILPRLAFGCAQYLYVSSGTANSQEAATWAESVSDRVGAEGR